MRRIIAVLAACLVAAATLAGCATGSTGPKPVDLSKPGVISTLCGDNARGILDFVQDAQKAKPSTGKRHALTKWGLSDAEAKNGDYLEGLVDALKQRAATPCEVVSLAQCRVDALTGYMTAQGFTDGEYVIGEDRVNTTLAQFSQTGSLGFGKVLKSRKALQAVFDSKEPKLVVAVQAQVQKFPEIEKSVLLNADNWEIVQMNIPVTIEGNSGISGGQQVSVGNTPKAAGDAAWVFVDPKTCVVPRASTDAVGNSIKKGAPQAQRPVGMFRVGCTNPTDNLWPKDWSLSPNGQWTPGEASGPATSGKESVNQKSSGDTEGNVIDNSVPSGTGSGDTTPDLPTGTVTAPGANQGGDGRSNDVTDKSATSQDPGGTSGATCTPDPDSGQGCD